MCSGRSNSRPDTCGPLRPRSGSDQAPSRWSSRPAHPQANGLALSLGGLFQGTAAARSLAGGAAEAMPGNAHRVVGDVVVEQVGEMHARTSVALERQGGDLVEVGIVDGNAGID